MKKIYWLLSSLGVMPFTVQAHTGEDTGMMHSMMHGLSDSGGTGMMIFWFSFWIILIGLMFMGVYAILKGISSSGLGTSETSSKALDILKERFVKGEISKKEFETKKKDLEK